MSKIIIEGPNKLKGTVKVQGSKNSAMKHIFIPLITEGEYTLENIPRIGSSEKHVELIQLFGAKADWISDNSIRINTKNLNAVTRIPKEYLYYTSGGNHLIPIIASKFGKCEIEVDNERTDYGGDQIGSRKFKDIIETLKQCGISSRENESSLIFKLESDQPFNFKVPVGSFTATVLALFSALFKNGKSSIYNYTKVHEFEDILDFLIQAGAKIKIEKSYLEVYGPTRLHGISYRNMNDPHDFVTWLFTGFATNSRIKIQGVQYKKMKLQTLQKVMQQMDVNVNWEDEFVNLKPQLSTIKPVSLIAGQFPLFTTEWQVLVSPLLTQIGGISKVVDTLYANRMQHWTELEKLGVKYEYYKEQKYPEVDNHPRAVKVNGPQKLHGGNINALDVRTGAALVIAGLVANGTTEISNIEHIDRGYENLVGRLQNLGANIKIIK